MPLLDKNCPKHGTSKSSKKVIRQAVADYMRSEGCNCCQNVEKHKKNKALLAKLLNVPKYSDGSGYDFGKFETKPETKKGR